MQFTRISEPTSPSIEVDESQSTLSWIYSKMQQKKACTSRANLSNHTLLELPADLMSTKYGVVAGSDELRGALPPLQSSSNFSVHLMSRSLEKKSNE